MSDTLRERLKEIAEDGFMPDRFMETALMAIAELDRLEAEVKKPRLPDGWGCFKTELGIGIQHLDGSGAAVCYSEDGARLTALREFLSAFLPTPDVATEPVQAAGDGAWAAPARWLVWSNEHRSWWRSNRIGYTSDINQAGHYTLEEAAKICRHGGVARAGSTGDGPYETMVPAYTFTPAEVPDLGQVSQTPTNTETAEKPKPVSLKEAFEAEFGLLVIPNAPVLAKHLEFILRTLDQER